MATRRLLPGGCIVLLLVVPARHGAAAEEWELILKQGVNAEHSQTRHDALKQVDTTTVKGLRSLWKVLAQKDPLRFDWYVREGAYEALLGAEGEEVEQEVERVLKGSGNEPAKEAILYAVTWKIRKEVVKTNAGNDDRAIEEFKYRLRKTRGVDYFALVLPVVREFDAEKKHLKRLQAALDDKSTRVRRAAITGLIFYPDRSSIPLLLGRLQALEKQKSRYYREWVLTRYALETLTGRYYRENVDDWLKWWEIAKKGFSLDKRVEEEQGKARRGKTVVVNAGGVQVTVNMKIAGEGYPLLVVPWRGYEVDYFRPYFHGVEEICRVFYVRMPSIDDYKGLARHGGSNLVQYPSAILAEALAKIMTESGLEHFAMLSHGPEASHHAMRVASVFPDRVTHLFMVNPRSSGEVYRDAIKRVEREGRSRGVSELVKGAQGILLGEDNRPTYMAADAAEEGGMHRMLYDVRFGDPTEPEVGTLEFLYVLPGGTSVLADHTWEARKFVLGSKLATLPTLIFMGERAVWTPMGDMQRVAGFFKRAQVVKLKQSAECPFMSETYLFTRHIGSFFKRYPPPEEDKSASKKEG